MNNLYFKKTDVIRSLFDYLEDKYSIGECIDNVKCIDIDEVISLIEAGRTEEAIDLLKGGSK